MDFLIVLVIVGIFFAWRLMPTKGIRQISTAELKKEVQDQSKQFIDVRTPSEYKINHIRAFKNMPLHTLANQAKQKLQKDKEVIVICQSGMRSMKASKILKKQGFKKVTNIRGGMSAWY